MLELEQDTLTILFKYMLVYKNYITFSILKDQVNLISNETDYGTSTVAEIKDVYYYLGDMEPTLGAALIAWQSLNKDLSNEELEKVINQNSLNK